MINDANKDELIEEYLLGKIGGALLDEFEERLATDDQFRREVALQKAIIRNIKAVGKKEWTLKLENIHNEMKFNSSETEQAIPENNKVVPLKRIDRKKYILSAAAVIILIIFSAVFLTINNKSNSDRIFISYYKPYPSLEQSTRGVPSGLPSEKKEAFEAYRNGNYDESIRLFRNILTKGEDEEALFYLGNAFLSVNDAGEAEITFKKYLTKYKEFLAESKWYLSLSYLRQKKKEDARKLLEELIKENNDYSTKAREILKEL